MEGTLQDESDFCKSSVILMIECFLLSMFRFNYDPTVQVPAKDYAHVPVSGKDRYKFFRRPIIPFLQQVPPDVLLQSSKLVTTVN